MYLVMALQETLVAPPRGICWSRENRYEHLCAIARKQRSGQTKAWSW
jgi:hypothetical protein